MNEYVPDPIERGAASCEAWEAESVRGDEFRCGCGKWSPLNEAETVSPDPYAIPVCQECFGKWFDHMERRNHNA